MKSYWIAGALCAGLMAGPSLAAGQSLGEVARQEADRRKAVTGGKVFTNTDLKPAPPPSTPAVTPTSVPGTTLPPPPSLEKAASAPTGAKGSTAAETTGKAEAPADEKKDEAYWRKRMSTARDSLSRAQTFQAALEARIGALSLDFANRDDPAQRAQVETDRLKAVAELERVKKDILQYQTELTAIADDARRAGVPAGWVR